MNNVNITEIRTYLKNNGATLTKQKMRLNGLDAYKVERSDGSFKLYTVKQLKEDFSFGVL